MKKIQIFGTGCPKCQKLAENADRAARELGVEYELEKVTDIKRITASGVVFTPALGVDGIIMSSGKVLDVEEIKALL